MLLVVDASTLVAEVLRRRGRDLLATPSLDLVAAAEAWAETQHELQKRGRLLVQHRRIGTELADQLQAEVTAVMTAHVRLASQEVYADRLPEAGWRIPRDPRDIPSVALALALDCGI